MSAGGMLDVDLAVVAGETQRVPLLLLAAVLAVPGLPRDLARNIVDQPFGDLAEALHRGDVGFLSEFAQRRRPRVLARVDAALRHLPDVDVVGVLGTVDAASDEGVAGAIEHGHGGAEA